MKAYVSEMARLMEVPDRDVVVGVAYLPYEIGRNGIRRYNRIDAAAAVVDYFQRLVDENKYKLRHTDSECFKSRVAKYTTRRNKAKALETAWRREDASD